MIYSKPFEAQLFTVELSDSFILKVLRQTLQRFRENPYAQNHFYKTNVDFFKDRNVVYEPFPCIFKRLIFFSYSTWYTQAHSIFCSLGRMAVSPDDH